MNAILVAQNHIRLAFREKVVLLIIAAMPLFLIFLLGYALKPLFQIQESGIARFPVLYLNQDEGPIGRALDFYLRHQLGEWLELKEETTDADAIRLQISRNAYPAAIIVAQPLSSGEDRAIEVFRAKEEPIKGAIVHTFVAAFVSQINTGAALRDAFAGAIPANDVEQWVNQAYGEILSRYGPNLVSSDESTSELVSQMSSFQFFSVSMLVFFLLNSGTGVATSIVREREEKTYLRLRSCPLQRWEFFAGKLLGNFVIALLQAGVIIGGTRVLFGVEWGKSGESIIVVTVLLILVSSGFGLLFASFLKSVKSITAVATTTVWTMTFLSGGFMHLSGLEYLGQFTVNKWAADSLYAIMQGQGLGDISRNVVILSLIGVVLFVVSLVLGQRNIADV